MTLLKSSRLLDVREMKNTQNFRCICGRVPSTRYSYRMTVGDYHKWNNNRCPECFKGECYKILGCVNTMLKLAENFQEVKWNRAPETRNWYKPGVLG